MRRLVFPCENISGISMRLLPDPSGLCQLGPCQENINTSRSRPATCIYSIEFAGKANSWHEDMTLLLALPSRALAARMCRSLHHLCRPRTRIRIPASDVTNESSGHPIRSVSGGISAAAPESHGDRGSRSRAGTAGNNDNAGVVRPIEHADSSCNQPLSAEEVQKPGTYGGVKYAARPASSRRGAMFCELHLSARLDLNVAGGKTTCAAVLQRGICEACGSVPVDRVVIRDIRHKAETAGPLPFEMASPFPVEPPGQDIIMSPPPELLDEACTASSQALAHSGGAGSPFPKETAFADRVCFANTEEVQMMLPQSVDDLLSTNASAEGSLLSVCDAVRLPSLPGCPRGSEGAEVEEPQEDGTFAGEAPNMSSLACHACADVTPPDRPEGSSPSTGAVAAASVASTTREASPDGGHRRGAAAEALPLDPEAKLGGVLGHDRTGTEPAVAMSGGGEPVPPRAEGHPACFVAHDDATTLKGCSLSPEPLLLEDLPSTHAPAEGSTPSTRVSGITLLEVAEAVVV